MALTEESLIDQIEVLATGHIQVRRADYVLRDGEVIAKSYHRHVIELNGDLTNEDPKVQAIATAAWSA